MSTYTVLQYGFNKKSSVKCLLKPLSISLVVMATDVCFTSSSFSQNINKCVGYLSITSISSTLLGMSMEMIYHLKVEIKYPNYTSRDHTVQFGPLLAKQHLLPVVLNSSHNQTLPKCSVFSWRCIPNQLILSANYKLCSELEKHV